MLLCATYIRVSSETSSPSPCYLSLFADIYIYTEERNREKERENELDGERERQVEGASDTLMEPEGTERRDQGNSREPQRRVRRRNEVPDNRPRLSVST